MKGSLCKVVNLERKELLKLTFDRVAEGVHTEGDRDEEGENLFSGTRRPAHQPRYVKKRVEDEEEGRPETHAAVHGVEI